MTTLKEGLPDWTDWDGAAFKLAVTLGLMEDGQESWLKNKGTFWTSNPRESSLMLILQELVKAGILEHRTEPDVQYRWNKGQ